MTSYDICWRMGSWIAVRGRMPIVWAAYAAAIACAFTLPGRVPGVGGRGDL